MFRDLWVAVEDVGGYVDGGDVGVDGNARKVLVLLKVDPGVADPETGIAVGTVRRREVALPLRLSGLGPLVLVVGNVHLSRVREAQTKVWQV